MKAWQQGAIAGGTAAFVVSAAMSAATAEGIEAGSLAEWAGAVGTVGALGFTSWALLHERQEKRSAEELTAREHALRVRLTVAMHAGETSDDGPHAYFVQPVALVENTGIRELEDAQIRVGIGDVWTDGVNLGTVPPGPPSGHPLGRRTWPVEDRPKGLGWGWIRWRDVSGRRWILTDRGHLVQDRRPVAWSETDGRTLPWDAEK